MSFQSKCTSTVSTGEMVCCVIDYTCLHVYLCNIHLFFYICVLKHHSQNKIITITRFRVTSYKGKQNMSSIRQIERDRVNINTLDVVGIALLLIFLLLLLRVRVLLLLVLCCSYYVIIISICLCGFLFL